MIKKMPAVKKLLYHLLFGGQKSVDAVDWVNIGPANEPAVILI